MSESTIITRFEYKHAEKINTPEKTMKEFIEQVKDNMVDKVTELDTVLKIMEKETSPIAKYARLLEYQEKSPNTGYQVFPDNIYYQLINEIFSYIKGGAIHKSYGEPLFAVGPLEFKLSMRKKVVEVIDTVDLWIPRGLLPHQEVTPFNRAMTDALEEYFHGDEKSGLKTFYALFMDKEAEVQWRRETGSEEPWDGQEPLSGLTRLRKWWGFHKTVKPEMEEIYQELQEKIEFEKKWKEESEIGKERNRLQEDGLKKLMKSYRLDLLMEAFKDEGFEVIYDNLPETGKTYV